VPTGGRNAVICYLVRLDGRFAPAFKSLPEILTGDPGSPHLWNLFMSDFILARFDQICRTPDRTSVQFEKGPVWVWTGSDTYEPQFFFNQFAGQIQK
jgi:hypothetical protein